MLHVTSFGKIQPSLEIMHNERNEDQLIDKSLPDKGMNTSLALGKNNSSIGQIKMELLGKSVKRHKVKTSPNYKGFLYSLINCV